MFVMIGGGDQTFTDLARYLGSAVQLVLKSAVEQWAYPLHLIYKQQYERCITSSQ